MNIRSKINPLLTLEYMQTESENKYFDRKSAQIRVVDLAPYISAFANADGGTLVIGISDKKRTLEGINSCGDEKINEFIIARGIAADRCRDIERNSLILLMKPDNRTEYCFFTLSRALIR